VIAQLALETVRRGEDRQHDNCNIDDDPLMSPGVSKCRNPLAAAGRSLILLVSPSKFRVCAAGLTSGSAAAFQAAFGARNSAGGKAST
jgi:hypothetical protein